MTKNLKFIAPMALVAFAALASCGGKAKASQRLKRDSFEETTGANIADRLTTIAAAQFTHDSESKPDGYNLAASYKQGTVKFNYEIGLTINARVLVPDVVSPIDINNFVIDLSDSITVSWDLDKKEAKIADSKDSTYIKQAPVTVTDPVTGEEKEEMHFFKYYGPNLSGIKYKLDIQPVVELLGGFENYMVAEISMSNGVFIPDFEFPSNAEFKLFFNGLGFGISGFGGLDYTIPIPTPKTSNLEERGSIYEGMLNVLAPGYYFGDPAINLLIQQAIADLDTIAYVKFGMDKTDVTTASVDLGIKPINLTILNTLIKDLSKIGLTMKGGTADLDYFFSYSKNFIHQQELVLNISDASLNYNNYDKSGDPKANVDVYGLNALVYAGEEVSAVSEVGTFSTEGYTEL